MLRPYLKPCMARTSKVLLSAGLLAVLCRISPSTYAQGNTAYDDTGTRKTRAAQEAEERVSLSADKIVEILRDEPGLLLQVKRLLVVKAYEQGRILDPRDLTDEALFRLLRTDDNIRVLATREIEDRRYVRAKPSREEIERERELAARRGGMRTSSENASDQVAKSPSQIKQNQEDAYWSKHEDAYGAKRKDGLDNYNLPGPPTDSYPPPPTYPSAPPPYPQNSAPESPVPESPARQLDRASLQQNINPTNFDVFQDSGGINTGSLSRISADDLPGLLSASSMASSSALGSGLGAKAGLLGPSSSFDRNLLPNVPSQTSIPGVDSQYSPRLAQPTQEARLEYPRRRIPSPSDSNEDRPRIVRRPNPYADVPSLYDLYAQVARRPAILERFGTGVFRNGTGNLDSLPMDLPVGPDYVLGPGDGLSIELSGSVSQHLQRLVDREGRVALPEVGALQVSGRSLGDVQQLMQSALRTQFHNIEADVSVARIRTVRVYVVGDVESPGAYDISSLSTPLNALYAAGGPTVRGSLRHLRQYRGKTLVQEIDAYDLLLHGIHTELARIQSGDTILISPIGPEITVEGMVQRPAIYELAGEKSLSEVLELAG